MVKSDVTTQEKDVTESDASLVGPKRLELWLQLQEVWCGG